MTLSLFVWLLLPLLAVVLLIDLATMGTERRAQCAYKDQKAAPREGRRNHAL